MIEDPPIPLAGKRMRAPRKAREEADRQFREMVSDTVTLAKASKDDLPRWAQEIVENFDGTVYIEVPKKSNSVRRVK